MNSTATRTARTTTICMAAAIIGATLQAAPPAPPEHLRKHVEYYTTQRDALLADLRERKAQNEQRMKDSKEPAYKHAAKVLLGKLDGAIDALEHDMVPPAINLNTMKAGQIGQVASEQARVIQIVDEQTMIVRTTEGNRKLLLRGWPTKDLADDDVCKLPRWTEIKGTTKFYGMTLFELVPFDPETIREYIPAAPEAPKKPEPARKLPPRSKANR